MAASGRLCVRSVMGVQRQACRAFFTKSKEKVFDDEERAAESIYIQKMERERLEKLKKKLAKEKQIMEANKGETSSERISSEPESRTSLG